MSAVEGNQENAFSEKKASVQKVMRAAFATTTVSVERKTQSSSLTPRSQTQK